MFSNMEIVKLKNNALRIARKNANFDTGNLRFNGITAKKTKNGFVLTWDGNIAFYWYYLEHGTEKMNPYYIVTTTRREVNDLIISYINSGGKMKDYGDEYKSMKKYERYLEKSRYDSHSEVLKERNERLYKSMLKAKGVLL